MNRDRPLRPQPGRKPPASALDHTLASFACPAAHVRASTIIRRHSTNPVDVRNAALTGLALSHVRDILDLGCGFGFMSARVAEVAAPDARLIGVDACAENRRPYLNVVRTAGRHAQFVHLRVRSVLPWPDASFDLVVAAYSLYFFPDALPDIARVLRPSGLFLAITHSETSAGALCAALGLRTVGSPLIRLGRVFSSENGRRRLARFFRRVEAVHYRNALRFGVGDLPDFAAYVRFKLPELAPQLRRTGPGPRFNPRRLVRRPGPGGELLLDKHDTIFRCRGPKQR